MPKVTELYAYVVADKDEDDEGIPAVWLKNMWMPMMGADLERAQSLRPEAERMSLELGKPLTLIRSTGIEVVEVIEP